TIPTDDSVQQVDVPQDQTEADDEDNAAAERVKTSKPQQLPQRKNELERVNACTDPSGEGDPDELAGVEAWSENESPEQQLDEGEVAYNYDEWDRELTDHRLGWCRVVEKRMNHG